MTNLPSMANIQNVIEALLDDDSGEFSEEEKLALLDQLATMEGQKVDGFCAAMRIMKGKAEAIKAERQRLDAREKSIMRQYDWLRNSYLAIMQNHGVKKIEGNAYTISIRKSEAVEITNLDMLRDSHPDFVKEKVEYQPDKTAIKVYIKEGNAVPGAELVTRESLQIR